MTESSSDQILVVDDDEAKRYSIVKILERAGFATTEAGTGKDALRLAAGLPDLIVLDVKLPDLSGFEVCRRIKSDPLTCTIPVLHLSTTFVDLQDKIHGLEGGADGYLTDALEPLELIATVKALLRARRAEEAAQLSTRQWHTTFDAINDGVILLDPSGTVVQVNQALERIMGQPRNDVVGLNFHELTGVPTDRPDSPFSRMLASRRREIIDLRLCNRWVHVAVDPVISGKGDLNGAICIVSDITDRREMEEELRRRADDLAAADQRKDEFLAMLAHELRNPLSPILNSLELLNLYAISGSGAAESLDIAKRQVKHIARLLDDLLDVSRFTQGKVQLRIAPVDFATVVSHAIETVAPLIKSKNHQLTVEQPAAPVHLMGDDTRLTQVLANLLNNAAKYTRPHGQINLAVSTQGDKVEVRVRDTGIGLKPEMLGHVFDLFVQDDVTLERTQGGLGIGLTLVRSLVEMHGGTVTAASEGLGKGSEFVVQLPLMHESPSANGHDPLEDRMLKTPPRFILVVDDHKESALSMARILERWGHQVAVAHDGPSALELISTDEFNLILLDIGLPGMDGYQVARQIRQAHPQSTIRLVALTGYGQEEDVNRSREAGFDQHLVKPVILESLRNLLES